MRAGLILGLGICAVATYASADPPVVIRHGQAFEPTRIDANSDGWISRQEAAAEADRRFAEMDTNGDGKLDGRDRGPVWHEADGDVEVRIQHSGGDEDGERVVRVERRQSGDAPQAETRSETRTERHVVIVRQDDNGDMTVEAPRAPRPPRPPQPPVFVMMLGNSEEYDANGDGALSREEFRAQQLAIFDASDGNRDGRVRFNPPPIPDMPAPPEAPEPPEPPAPPRH